LKVIKAVIITRVRWMQNLIWHLGDAYGRTKRSSSTLPTQPSSSNSIGGRIHLLCGWQGRPWARMPTVQHIQYGVIQKGGGLSEDDFQVAVVEGGSGSTRRLLQRLVVFKASGTETNLLGNKQRRLHQLQNGVWGGDGKRDIWSALIRKGGVLRQRWQGSPESNSTQSTEGSESDKIVRKCLTQKEKRGRHPIQAGLETHTQTCTHAFISNKAHCRPRACNSPRSEDEKSHKKMGEPPAPLIRVESRWSLSSGYEAIMANNNWLLNVYICSGGFEIYLYGA